MRVPARSRDYSKHLIGPRLPSCSFIGLNRARERAEYSVIVLNMLSRERSRTNDFSCANLREDSRQHNKNVPLFTSLPRGLPFVGPGLPQETGRAIFV